MLTNEDAFDLSLEEQQAKYNGKMVKGLRNRNSIFTVDEVYEFAHFSIKNKPANQGYITGWMLEAFELYDPLLNKIEKIKQLQL